MDEDCLLFSTSSSAMMTAAMGLANQNGFAGLAAFSSPYLYRPPEHIYGQLPDYGDYFLAFMNYYIDNTTGTGKPKVPLCPEQLHRQSAVDCRPRLRRPARHRGPLGRRRGYGFELTTTTISEIESLTASRRGTRTCLHSAPRPHGRHLQERPRA
jgi:branched-chain amino acid transport system substrate-binding protein